MTTFYLFFTPKLLKLTCFYLKSYIFKHFQTKQYLKKTKNMHLFFFHFKLKFAKNVHFLPKILEKAHFLNIFEQKILEKVHFLNIFKQTLSKKG